MSPLDHSHNLQSQSLAIKAAIKNGDTLYAISQLISSAQAQKTGRSSTRHKMYFNLRYSPVIVERNGAVFLPPYIPRMYGTKTFVPKGKLFQMISSRSSINTRITGLRIDHSKGKCAFDCSQLSEEEVSFLAYQLRSPSLRSLSIAGNMLIDNYLMQSLSSFVTSEQFELLNAIETVPMPFSVIRAFCESWLRRMFIPRCQVLRARITAKKEAAISLLFKPKLARSKK
uniref:Permuted papain-like amidase enzyme, YaeF/YiiX, C92 family n=1 Tax=Steinernema glaseri TaxID=37863 RepID=A0A1I7YW84_9BILA